MSLEMAREWLRSARLDLDSIEYILDVEHLTSIAAFHSQQAVEKCFKSILEYKEHKVPKTHDVLSLYNTIKKIFFIDINEDMLGAVEGMILGYQTLTTGSKAIEGDVLRIDEPLNKAEEFIDAVVGKDKKTKTTY